MLQFQLFPPLKFKKNKEICFGRDVDFGLDDDDDDVESPSVRESSLLHRYFDDEGDTFHRKRNRLNKSKPHTKTMTRGLEF